MKMDYDTKINKQCGLLIRNLKAKAIDFRVYYFCLFIIKEGISYESKDTLWNYGNIIGAYFCDCLRT